MEPLLVRNLKIGEGMPKICASLTGSTAAEVLDEAKELLSLPADLAEWRADWFAGDCFDTVFRLRETLKDMPLLFTFRTAGEGGKKSLPAGEYEELNLRMAATGAVDLIDVELFTEGEGFPDFVKALHAYPVKVLASSHDFEKTPPKQELLARFDRMQEGGADLLKIAVMPRTAEDVLTLFSASLTRMELPQSAPFLALSMGSTGLISRLCAEFIGSALTFGSARRASAPGQIGVEQLKSVLVVIHEGLTEA